MAQVICTRQNASEEISGVKFEKHADGMISVDCAFCSRVFKIP